METFKPQTSIDASRTPETIEEFSKSFLERYKESGLEVFDNTSLRLAGDSTLLFPNSTMCRFKSEIESEQIPEKGIAVHQLCLRTQDLSQYENPEYTFNFTSLFNMVGLILPKSFTPHVFNETYTWLISCGIRPERIYVKTTKNECLANTCIPENFSGNILYDTEKPTFYKWNYGISGVAGEGITFSVLQSNGEILDIGNIIAFVDKNRNVVAWESAFGVETLTARRDNESLYKKHKIFEVFGEIADEKQKPLLDSLNSAIELIAQGFEPGAKKQSYVLRKYLNIISKLSRKLNVDIVEVTAKYCSQKGYDADTIGNKITTYLLKIHQQKEKNTKKYLKFLNRNPDLSDEEKLRIAKESFSLDADDIEYTK